jgi:sialic acid synthase SpsE
MNYQTEFCLGSRTISNDSATYFIADIAANHDGDIERAKDLIYLCAEAGADAAKFQHFQAETIVSDKGFKGIANTASHQSNWDKTVFETYQDASLDCSWTQTLKDTCVDAGIDFFTSPYSLALIEFVDPFIPAYKIGSGDITYKDIIQSIAAKGKPVFLATGASDMHEVEQAVADITRINPQLLLMQCNTNYTASLENFKHINLNVLDQFKRKFPGLLLGLSDHTPGHATVLGAIALGACAIEKHFTDDNNRLGPDHLFSMNPKSWKEMVERSRELKLALGTGVKVVEGNEKETVILQRRALYFDLDLKQGDCIRETDLVALRPCPADGFTPYQSTSIVGKILNANVTKGDRVTQAILRQD